MMSRFLDQAIAAISLQKPKPAETRAKCLAARQCGPRLCRRRFLLAGMQLAAWTFAVSALAQASYIYVSRRATRCEDPPDAQGRQRPPTPSSSTPPPRRSSCGPRIADASSASARCRRRRSSRSAARCCSMPDMSASPVVVPAQKPASDDGAVLPVCRRGPVCRRTSRSASR